LNAELAEELDVSEMAFLYAPGDGTILPIQEIHCKTARMIQALQDSIRETLEGTVISSSFF
jgi:hypothetical protein